MQRVRVAVAVADSALERLPEVLSACRACGFESDVALATVGIVLGSVPPSQLGQLRAVPGVAAVERQRALQARRGPPGS